MFDTNILKEKIERIKIAYENGRFSDALIGAINTGNGLMQQRVFAQNEDVSGNSFGKYIGKKQKTGFKPSKNKIQNIRNKNIAGLSLTSYQIKRAKAGRQIAKKDLEFHGGLRRAIETKIEDEKSVVLEFNNTEAARVARGQEQQIANIRNGLKGTTKGIGAIKIFGLNNFERKEVDTQALELIGQIIKQ